MFCDEELRAFGVNERWIGMDWNGLDWKGRES